MEGVSFGAGRILKVNKEEVVGRVRIRMSEEGREVGGEGEEGRGNNNEEEKEDHVEEDNNNRVIRDEEDGPEDNKNDEAK